MQSLLALSRIAAGLGFLILPAPITSLLHMPFTPEAALGCRMAGARDIVIGALLYTANTATTTTPATNEKPDTARAGSKNRAWSATQTALVAGIAVDAMDVLACLWCYADGSLPLTPALLLGGGAGVLLDLGVWCLYFYVPFDIQYLILAGFARRDPPEMTQPDWRIIVNLLCVCKLWHSSLQDLLVQHLPANALLRLCKTGRGVGAIAVQRAVTDYIAREEARRGTDADADSEKENSTASHRWKGGSVYSTKAQAALAGPNVTDALLLDLQYCIDTAAERGYIDLLRLGLEAGVEYESRDALRAAIKCDQVGVVEFLLDGGYIDLEQRLNGTSALGFAVREGRAAIVQLFLARGADADIRLWMRAVDVHESLSLACYATYKNYTDVLRVLLEHGLPAEDALGPERAILWAVVNANIETATVLIENGVDLSQRLAGDWPLRLAVRRGDIDMVNFLLERGGVPEERDEIELLFLEAEMSEAVEVRRMLGRKFGDVAPSSAGGSLM
ncbi:ankyrin repeat-containing domain protein [Aspergillus carlsbadensis]|nr:ankyrin repeat-containing domain protein [Aspergillus carlsbadensis]